MPGWGGCDICLTGLEQTKGGFSTSTDYVRHIKLPLKFEAEDVQRARKDCEILAKKLQADPERIVTLLAAAQGNDVTKAQQIAQEIGLTEEEFAKSGGGLMWLVVIAVLLYATDAY